MAVSMKRVALLAAVLALAFPAIASATILINRGMFGVSLGETMKQARQKLGAPGDASHTGGRTIWLYSRRKLGLEFRGTHNLLHFLYTENPKERTARGVGVGSSEQDVMRLVPGVKCGTTPGLPGTDCFVFADRHGSTYGTDFSIAKNGRVGNVSIDWLR
jgi:hypothetical protein